MAILLTGGTGKSASPLAKLLLAANQPFLLATRSGQVPAPYKGVRFDWLDASTYNNPFEADPSIDRIYLIAPPTYDALTPMKAFINLAVAKGVKRFILMSAGLLETGGPIMGKVHEYLKTLGVEFCVLRPSWFFDNFAIQYAARIKSHNDIVGAAKDGKIPWVSTEDIADVAFKALVGEVIEHDNPIIVGPELYTYDQIAAMLSEVLGREIKYTRLTPSEYKQSLVERGLPEAYADMMVAFDEDIALGTEEQLFQKADVVGKRRLRDFFEANKETWQL